MPLTEVQAVDRLLDRFSFGAPRARRDQARAAGLEGAARLLLEPAGPDRGVAETPAPTLPSAPDPKSTDDIQVRRAYNELQAANRQAMTRWWLARMAAVHDATERLTFFWHGHFATSAAKVRPVSLMLAQNQTLRTHALGSFGDLARAMAVDPAMIVWLDGQTSTSRSPNENLARELMELFTLGVGHYSEQDVREGARALTGWLVRDERAVLVPSRQDRGPKTIFGQTGAYDTNGFVDLVLGRPQVPEFIASRLWFRLMGQQPMPASTRAAMVSAYAADGRAGNIRAMLTALVRDPAFRTEAYSLVKSPVEWLVGLLKAFELPIQTWEAKEQERLVSGAAAMGQHLMVPPSVGGWPGDSVWLSTSAAVSRANLAQVLTKASGFAEEAKGASAQAIASKLSERLGVTWSPRSRAALDAAGSPANALVVAACSPEVVVSR